MVIDFNDGVTLDIPQELADQYPYIAAANITMYATAVTPNVPTGNVKIVVGYNRPLICVALFGYMVLAKDLLSDDPEAVQMVGGMYDEATASWEMIALSGEEILDSEFASLTLGFDEMVVDFVYLNHDVMLYGIGDLDTSELIDTGYIAIPKTENLEMNMSMPYSFFKQLADSTRAALGVNTKYNSKSLLEAIRQIPSIEAVLYTPYQTLEPIDDSFMISVLEGTLTELIREDITSVPGSAFCRHNDRTTNGGAYSSAASLTKVDLPNAVSIGSKAFACQKSLTTVNVPKVQTIGSDAFAYCGYFTINMPEVTSIGARAFRACSMSKMTFYNEVSLEYIPFFEGSISKLDFHKPFTELEPGSTFCQATGLSAMILRDSESVQPIKIESGGNFYKTPIESGTGYIYVPASLVDAYKADANWSVVASQIRAIEDYPDICGT